MMIRWCCPAGGLGPGGCHDPLRTQCCEGSFCISNGFIPYKCCPKGRLGPGGCYSAVLGNACCNGKICKKNSGETFWTFIQILFIHSHSNKNLSDNPQKNAVSLSLRRYQAYTLLPWKEVFAQLSPKWANDWSLVRIPTPKTFSFLA